MSDEHKRLLLALEPDAIISLQNARNDCNTLFQASIAISLKRIANLMEKKEAADKKRDRADQYGAIT